MMRSPKFFSVACRAPNGEIVLRTEAIEKTWIGKQRWLKLPFLRGALAILDSMALGLRSFGCTSASVRVTFRSPQITSYTIAVYTG